MKRRVHRALDGELPLERLNVAEREELADSQAVIEQVLAQIPEPPPAPDMSGAVLWRIAHAAPAQPVRNSIGTYLQGGLRWLWQPRPVQLRPAAALAVLALLLSAGALLLRTDAPAVASGSPETMLVQFRVGAEGAREVVLVGDFSGWDERYQLEQVAPGVWATTVPLEPGVYDYAFVIDGATWILDPLAPAVADGFGGANSRVSVMAPERRTRT